MSKKKSEIEVRRQAAPASAEGWPSILSLRHEIDRLFDEFGTGLLRQPLSRRMQALFQAGSELTLRPATEFVEFDSEYRMAADDIDIKLSDGTITIRGEKLEEKKEEKEDCLLNERRHGEFQRTLTMRSRIDADAVTADFTYGLLTVTLSKTAEVKQKERKVEIKTAA